MTRAAVPTVCIALSSYLVKTAPLVFVGVWTHAQSQSSSKIMSAAGKGVC